LSASELAGVTYLLRSFAVTRTTRTGAERYFAARAEQPGFADAYDEARRRIDQIDRLVLALDERRETMGITKAELARRADIAPEAVRRLFSTDSPNPTIGTLTAIADALDLELVTRKRRVRQTESSPTGLRPQPLPRHAIHRNPRGRLAKLGFDARSASPLPGSHGAPRE
jgi:transcriptional regulator with XRE-family HTH domain